LEKQKRKREETMTTNLTKDLDLVVYGATGFTGQLVVEYLAEVILPSNTPRALRVGVAGRNRGKLDDVKRDAVARCEVGTEYRNRWRRRATT
jgi:short subunit dehydrogenase-like uncharacterized protein